MSTWSKLFHLNENENAEKKGKFTYLSWTHAWTALMKQGLDVSYLVKDVEYHNDGTATVHTEMTIDNITFPMWLPVMDNRNQSIVSPNANDINKARMRCLVKNIAMFGLGIYIYSGEDLPEAAPAILASPEAVNLISERAASVGADIPKALAHFQVSSLSELTEQQANAYISKLNKAA